MSNEQKWRAPVSIFEHYFSKEYSKQRAFFHEKMDLLELTCFHYTMIRGKKYEMHGMRIYHPMLLNIIVYLSNQ